MSKIAIEDYEVHDMDVDEQRKFNHINCPAGMDTKHRLYIKRIEDGHLYYCHHCGTRGIQRTRLSKVRAYQAQHTGTKGSSGTDNQKPELGNETLCNNQRGINQAVPRLELPSDIDADPRCWPREARGWVLRYITEKESKDYGICYSGSNRRVYLPSVGDCGISVIQSRKIFPDDPKPKYLTQRNYMPRNILFNGSVRGDLLVLTEDMLSAIKCARHADAYPLLSSSIDTVGLTTIMRAKYPRIVIWLDDDNRHVKKSQRDLKNLLELCTDAVVKVVHTKGKDPKAHTDKEIKDILTSTARYGVKQCQGA